jgi:hypothetical protein
MVHAKSTMPSIRVSRRFFLFYYTREERFKCANPEKGWKIPQSGSSLPFYVQRCDVQGDVVPQQPKSNNLDAAHSRDDTLSGP